MAINAAQLNRFSLRAGETMAAALPVSVIIDGTTYSEGCWSAGETKHEGLDQTGELVSQERVEFRIPKTAMETPPTPGTIVERVSDEKQFRVLEVPNRPHETHHRLICGWLHGSGE